MGRQIDLDRPLSPEDKQYLRDRGRPYLIPANERRFGVNGDKTPEPHEYAGASTQSAFYDNAEREKAVYDVGGAVLPGVVLDHDTGRAYDRENGVTVEFTGPGHTPGGYDLRQRVDYEPEGFTSRALDASGNEVDDEFDEDIVGYVTGLNVKELKADLKENEVVFSSDLNRDGLRDKLVVFYQDLRNGGAELSFVDDDEADDSATDDATADVTEEEDGK